MRLRKQQKFDKRSVTATVLGLLLILVTALFVTTAVQRNNSREQLTSCQTHLSTSYVGTYIPKNALSIMSKHNISCYHLNCFYARNNPDYVICYVEIGRQTENTCTIGDGRVVAIDCHLNNTEYWCIKSPRTVFDTEIDEKLYAMYYNFDKEKCCWLNKIVNSTPGYQCVDDGPMNCLSRLKVNVTI